MTTADDGPTPVPARQLYRIPEAMCLLSLSRSAVYEEIRAGRLRSVKRGRTRLVPAQAITEYVQLLINESSEEELYAETA
ncbi:helix-turn-helix domain-containing protein [Saccharomonospora azurea]|uniref:helix-turn-helix domain-containing protein n=1 Tax=Saccharomonospora azurea TaxID=40988 RepID=UPI003D9329D3